MLWHWGLFVILYVIDYLQEYRYHCTVTYVLYSSKALSWALKTYTLVMSPPRVCIRSVYFYVSMLEIAAGHWPFSNQFQHNVMVNQNLFGQPNLLYSFSGTAINNLQKSSIFNNSWPISNPYFYHCMLATPKFVMYICTIVYNMADKDINVVVFFIVLNR